MNKPYLLLCVLCFLAGTPFLPAQTQTWHTRFGPSPINSTFFRLKSDGDRFLLNTDRQIVEIDRLGTVTGFVDFGSTRWMTAALKQYAQTAENPYFIVLRRGYPVYKNFRLEVYQPGIGLVQEVEFLDSLGGNNFARPHILELADYSFLLFGRKFYHKVTYDETAGFTLEWSRPLQVAPTAVLEHNSVFILADELGRLQALDQAGNSLWLRNHPLEFHALKATPDGFIGCGANADKKAVAIKLNFDGSAQWTQSYPETVFYDIVPTADGGYAACGVSANNWMALAKLHADGSRNWAREYAQTTPSFQSAGYRLLELPEGGFLLAGEGKTATHILRTDRDGKAPEAEDARIDSRRLKTATIQSDFRPGASLFFDGSKSSFVSLADSNAATMFTFAPWIGGIDADNTIRVAAADYSDNFKRSDYRPGSSLTAAKDFNRVWLARRVEIQNLRKDYLQNKNLNEPVPYDLLTWPGRGNPQLKYNLDFTPVETDPDLFPAPFVDANHDDRYNVYDGDYPAIKGDQMVWSAFTDSSAHSRTYGKSLLVDLQVSAYTYDCLQNPLIDQSLFVEYELINRSENAYSEAYAGFFADPDLGCYLDDYIGSIPQVDAWYVYNQNTPDRACQNARSFGADVPVQSVSFLSPSLDQAIYHLNPSLGTFPSGMIDPYTILGYYQNLRGKWIDGMPLTVGGSGYNQFNLNTTNYFFSDNPADPQGWSLCIASQPFYDRRVVSSHGPFTFAAGDTFRVELAFSLHRNIPLPCPDIFGLIVPPLEQLQTWHSDAALDLHPGLAPVYSLLPGRVLRLDATVPNGAYVWSTGSEEATAVVSEPGRYWVTITGATGCRQVEEVLVQAVVGVGETPQTPQWKLWPNPATKRVFIDCPDCVSEPLQARLYNAQGQVALQEAGLIVPGFLELPNLPAGLYWLELRNIAGGLGARRLAVER